MVAPAFPYYPVWVAEECGFVRGCRLLVSYNGKKGTVGLLRAIDVIREMNHTGQRALPAQVPTGFIRRVWRPLALRSGGVGRRA
jgi:hypothetical protein